MPRAEADAMVPASVIELSAADQLAFWRVLEAPVKLTSEQKTLAKIMRGEARSG